MLFAGVKEKSPVKTSPSTPRSASMRHQDRENEKLRKAAAFYAHVLPEASPIETGFRHGHWKHRRDRIRSMMVRSGARVHALNRWDECGGQCVVQYSASTQRVRLSANYCKSRHCEPCMRAKANLIARNLRERLEAQRRDAKARDPFAHRFITVTLKHSRAPLADQIARLNRCFKILRNSEAWKMTQLGGAATLEVKWTGSAWHPHLHIISEGSYLGKQQLSELWRKATGDSFIVDIQALKDVADTCHYVSKYITKGVNPAVWTNDDTAIEWLLASKGVRICNTFGSWRGFRLTKGKSDVTDWTPVASLQNLISRAAGGELAAQGWLLQLRPPGSSDERQRRSGDDG